MHYKMQDSGNVLMNISPASNFYMDKTITTIKQFYRDWSEEGAKERDLCYKPIIDEILRIFPPDTWYGFLFVGMVGRVLVSMYGGDMQSEYW